METGDISWIVFYFLRHDLNNSVLKFLADALLSSSLSPFLSVATLGPISLVTKFDHLFLDLTNPSDFLYCYSAPSDE